jgi:hypothetical protein
MVSPYGCARCGHPLPLHSNGRTACKAIGCHAGPDGGPCPAYEEHREEVKIND